MKAAFFIERWDRYAAVLLAAVTGVIWFLLSSFDKSLTVYHDEVTYTEAARDIYNGISPLLQHLRPSYFSKIFYSYLIAPGFAFSDPTVWQTAMNGIFTGLTVLFAWLLARVLIQSRIVSLVSALLTASLPVFSYSVYATPDCLFFCETALSFLIFAALCRGIYDGAEDKPLILLSVLLGLVNFISYFTKEVAAAYVLSDGAVILAAAWMHGGRKKPVILTLACYAATFILGYLYLRFVLLSGISLNSYSNQMFPFSVYLEMNGWSGLLEKALYMAVGALFSVYLVPLIVPLLAFRNLTETGRMVFVSVLSAMIMLTVSVIWLITWKEDYANEFPSWQFRYHNAYLPVLIPLACMSFERIREGISKTWLLIAVIPLFILMYMFFPEHENNEFARIYDNATLNFFRYSLSEEILPFLRLSSHASSLAMLLFIAAGFLPFVRIRKPSFGGLLVKTGTVLSLVLFVITGCSYSLAVHEQSRIEHSLKDDAMKLAGYLSSLPPSVRILFVEKALTNETSAFYTYTNRPVMALPFRVLRKETEENGGVFDFSAERTVGSIEADYNSRYRNWYVRFPAPDLIVETSSYSLLPKDGSKYIRTPGGHYFICQNARNERISVMKQSPDEKINRSAAKQEGK